MKDMTKGSPIRTILHFALPLYIGQQFQTLYGLIDTRIIGSVLGDSALAAVGATASLNDMLIEFLNGIVCGFGIIIANAFGAHDRTKLRRSVAGTATLSAVVTAGLVLLLLLFLQPVLTLLNVPPELLPQATSYIRIIIAGLMATTMYNVCAAVLRAVGDSVTPLVFLIASNVLNILLDLYFVKVLTLGVEGAAAATVLSQGIAAVICWLYMRGRYPDLRIRFSELRPDRETCAALLPTGLSMGFMISFVTMGSVVLQTQINRFSSFIIVAHMAARKVVVLFLTPFFMLGTALATFCGQNHGAKEYDRIRTGIRSTLGASSVWYLFAVAAIFAGAPWMIRLLTATAETEVIDQAVRYLRINAPFFILPSVICILRNSMQGFGDTRTPLISSVIELAGKALIAVFLVPVIGYTGIILSEPIVWALMVIPLVIGITRFMKEKRGSGGD